MSNALNVLHPAILICNTSLRKIGVEAGINAAFSLLEALTIRQFPLCLRTQNFGDVCSDFDSRIMPAACLASKNASIASTFSLGNGYCRVVQYFVPGSRSISCRTPRSGGSTDGGSSETTSANSLSNGSSGKSRILQNGGSIPFLTMSLALFV